MSVFFASKNPVPAGAIQMVPPRGKANTPFHAGSTCYLGNYPSPTQVRAEHVQELKKQGWFPEEEFRRSSTPPPPGKPYQGPQPVVLTVPPGEPLVRMLPPINGREITVYARRYQVETLAPQDVPMIDTQILSANGWTRLGMVGTAANRPARAKSGERRFEEARELVSDGITWRDPGTGEQA